MLKPMLTVAEQIEHLKDKGVQFEICSEAEAYHYLRYNNNFFKLASYRKNYDKYIGGKKEGLYINLDFGYLKDLAIIDMTLRYAIVQLALDIEHYAKLELLRMAEDGNEDGYSIVTDFKNSLEPTQYQRLISEIERNKTSDYCKDLFDKYADNLPVWAFMEMIPFGRMVEFYGYCANRYQSKPMQDNYFVLRSCRKIRNASAHSSCILNDLRPNTNRISTNNKVLRSISVLSKYTVRKRMSNTRINQIVTLLYTHKRIVTSEGVRRKAIILLTQLKERINRNIHYYETNDLVFSNLNFLCKTIDIFSD